MSNPRLVLVWELETVLAFRGSAAASAYGGGHPSQPIHHRVTPIMGYPARGVIPRIRSTIPAIPIMVYHRIPIKVYRAAGRAVAAVSLRTPSTFPAFLIRAYPRPQEVPPDQVRTPRYRTNMMTIS